MPLIQPQSRDKHVNKMLTDILIGYSNSAYIADQIFPVVLVDKQTDIIPFMKQSAFFRDEGATPIAEGGEASEVGYEVDVTNTYYAQRYGLRHFISDDQRQNEDAPFNADREATLLLVDKMGMRRERSFVANYWKTGVWTTDVTGGTTVTKWSDYGSPSPIEDIRTYKRTIRRLTGSDPNVLILGDLAYDRLVDHPDMVGRIVYSQMGIVSDQLLATLFGVEKVLVGKSIYTASAQGTAEASVTYTANWDDDALLMYVPPRPSLWAPAAGYTFVWNTGMGRGLEWTRKYREESKLGDYVEVRSYFDQKKCVANAGAFFSDIVD